MALSLTPSFVPRMRDAWRADYDTPILSRLSSDPMNLRRYSADSVDTRKRQTTTIITHPRMHGYEVQAVHLHGRGIRIGGLPADDSDDDDDEEEDDDGGNEMDETSPSFVASRGREDFSVLVDFLKNTKPPPENYMSIPYETFRDRKERGKWSMLRRVGRRRSRSVPKVPPKPLILPDSAVSGITIGGHRHIAISIPLEAMPFADAANSHCFDSSTRPYRDPDPDLLVPLPKRDRAARATRVGATSSTSLSRPCRPSRSMSSTQFGQRANPPAYKSHERRNSQQDQGSSCMCPEEPNAASCHMKMEHLQETGYPARRSSITASRGYTLASTADGMVSCPRNGRSTATGTHTFPSYSWLPANRGAASPSKRSSRHPSPISEEPSGTESGGKKEAGSEGEASASSSATSASSGTYLGSDSGPSHAHAQENVTRLSPRVSIACRREKVRDKKRRDMEALRKAKERGQPSEVRPEASKNSGNATSQGQGPQLVLCPIQVVVDMEPVLLSAKRPESFNEKLQRLAEAHNQRNSLLSVESSSSSSSASHRAPLSTLSGSPLPRQRPFKKTRPDHRGPVEREEKASRDEGHGRTHPSHQRSNETRTDRQILRLYDTYRENRIQDAERRIRKLENNRDVWLQALIPLLDDMNRTIKAVNGKNQNRHPDGDVASVDEAQVRGSNTAMASSTMTRASEGKSRGGGGRKRSSKDMSLSREQLVALLAQKLEEMADYDEDDDDDAESWYERTKLRSDANGMVSMELLMKELAGEARRRQRRLAAEMRGDTD